MAKTKARKVSKVGMKFRQSRTKFTDAKKQVFIDTMAKTGRNHASAEAAGVTYETVRSHIKADQEFAAAVEAARQQYGEWLESEVERRGVEGWEEPVFNYKDGSILGTVKKFSDKMLELALKKHVPEYRDKSSLDLEHSGGVLVIPAKSASDEEWAKEHAEKVKPKH